MIGINTLKKTKDLKFLINNISNKSIMPNKIFHNSIYSSNKFINFSNFNIFTIQKEKEKNNFHSIISMETNKLNLNKNKDKNKNKNKDKNKDKDKDKSHKQNSSLNLKSTE